MYSYKTQSTAGNHGKLLLLEFNASVVCSFCKNIFTCTEKEKEDIYCSNCHKQSYCSRKNNFSYFNHALKQTANASHGVCPNCLSEDRSETAAKPPIDGTLILKEKTKALAMSNEDFKIATTASFEELTRKRGPLEKEILEPVSLENLAARLAMRHIIAV